MIPGRATPTGSICIKKAAYITASKGDLFRGSGAKFTFYLKNYVRTAHLLQTSHFSDTTSLNAQHKVHVNLKHSTDFAFVKSYGDAKTYTQIGPTQYERGLAKFPSFARTIYKRNKELWIYCSFGRCLDEGICLYGRLSQILILLTLYACA